MDCKWPKPSFVDVCLESCNRRVDTQCGCIATSSAEDQGSLSSGKFSAGCEKCKNTSFVRKLICFTIQAT